MSEQSYEELKTLAKELHESLNCMTIIAVREWESKPAIPITLVEALTVLRKSYTYFHGEVEIFARNIEFLEKLIPESELD